MDFFERSISCLPTEGLYTLAKDAQDRIGSFVVGGSADDPYVEKQRKIISLVQDELVKRSKS